MKFVKSLNVITTANMKKNSDEFGQYKDRGGSTMSKKTKTSREIDNDITALEKRYKAMQKAIAQKKKALAAQAQREKAEAYGALLALVQQEHPDKDVSAMTVQQIYDLIRHGDAQTSIPATGAEPDAEPAEIVGTTIPVDSSADESASNGDAVWS